MDEQVEDEISHRPVAEEHAERHQRERDRESEHDENDEHPEHDHAQLGISDTEHQIDPFRTPISSSSLPTSYSPCSAFSRMTFSSSSTSWRRWGHSPVRM